mgnify:CR=1 FL=1|jgi:hypothetical protein
MLCTTRSTIILPRLESPHLFWWILFFLVKHHALTRDHAQRIMQNYFHLAIFLFHASRQCLIIKILKCIFFSIGHCWDYTRQWIWTSGVDFMNLIVDFVSQLHIINFTT